MAQPTYIPFAAAAAAARPLKRVLNGNHRRFPKMAPAPPAVPVHEGVFAIAKPPAVSSAQVIRDVQKHFDPSEMFKSWFEREQRNVDVAAKKGKRPKRVRNVKIGHGGTLDVMATGVLILGVGSGTKDLNYFMTGCNKSYEAVLLFGAATDTYDTEGKVVSRKPYENITKEILEEAMAKWRGKVMQKPPIYSALRVQGKRYYEYAREGKELPIEIKERPVEVLNLELVEWMDGGTHEWQWPDREAVQEDKVVAKKMLDLDSDSEGKSEDNSKRKREIEGNETSEKSHEPSEKRAKTDTEEPRAEDEAPGRDQQALEQQPPTVASGETEIASKDANPAVPPRKPCPAPACRIRMDVTSGFYVRSLCHDLGKAVGSLGIMASLVRTRQGQFELGKNVFAIEELEKGEEAWGPQIKQMLDQWQEQAPARAAKQ